MKNPVSRDLVLLLMGRGHVHVRYYDVRVCINWNIAINIDPGLNYAEHTLWDYNVFKVIEESHVPCHRMVHAFSAAGLTYPTVPYVLSSGKARCDRKTLRKSVTHSYMQYFLLYNIVYGDLNYLDAVRLNVNVVISVQHYHTMQEQINIGQAHRILNIDQPEHLLGPPTNTRGSPPQEICRCSEVHSEAISSTHMKVLF